MSLVSITGLDHIVLNVRDVERSLDFYMGVLGLEGERVEQFRKGEVSFPSVRIDARTLIDLQGTTEPPPENAARNLNHFCMVTSEPDVNALVDSLASHGVEILSGPAQRWGAQGGGTSVYIRDPDGNQVEIKTYGK